VREKREREKFIDNQLRWSENRKKCERDATFTFCSKNKGMVATRDEGPVPVCVACVWRQYLFHVVSFDTLVGLF